MHKEGTLSSHSLEFLPRTDSHVSGKWHQIHQKIGRISSPGDRSTYLKLKGFQDGIGELDKARQIPFPFPLQQNLNYVIL